MWPNSSVSLGLSLIHHSPPGARDQQGRITARADRIAVKTRCRSWNLHLLALPGVPARLLRSAHPLTASLELWKRSETHPLGKGLQTSAVPFSDHWSHPLHTHTHTCKCMHMHARTRTLTLKGTHAHSEQHPWLLSLGL